MATFTSLLKLVVREEWTFLLEILTIFHGNSHLPENKMASRNTELFSMQRTTTLRQRRQKKFNGVKVKMVF